MFGPRLAALAQISMIRFGGPTRATEANPSVPNSVTRILLNNPNRVEFTFVNVGTLSVAVGLSNGVSVTNGIVIPPGGGITALGDEDGEMVGYDWWAIASSGTQSMYVQEVLQD